jgi:glycosyltransferase involved in cell wall biosynthesis
VRIAVFENLQPGGAKRAAYELGRLLTARHQLDLYRLQITPTDLFDLAPMVRQVHTYRYRPLFGLLETRLLQGGPGILHPYTLFAPLQRLHREIARDIDAGGYDAALVHGDWMTQAPYLLGWLDRTPSVYYCQEPLRVARERSLLANHLATVSSRPLGRLRALVSASVFRRLAAANVSAVQKATAVVANSYYTMEQVWATYAREASVCYLGTDTQRFSPGSNGHRRREVLMVGGPMESKGHRVVIQALGRLPANDARPALRIVMTSSSDAPLLESLARDLGVSLQLEIGLEDESLIERYRCAIATICAGHLEPFGLTAIESMACATPVIAVREGGYRESVDDGQSGLLVDRDPQSIADAISRLATNPGYADTLGRRARQEVLRCWTWERAGKQIEAILSSVVSRVAEEPETGIPQTHAETPKRLPVRGLP